MSFYITLLYYKVGEVFTGAYMNTSLLDLSAKEIVAELDRRVVGQSEAKKTLSIALRTSAMRYYQRFIERREPTIPISNVLLIGSTGTGKTMLIREISRIFSVPVLILDATEFTPSGYKGKDIDTILKTYGDVVAKFCIANFGKTSLHTKWPEYISKGLIFIDEFDKLSMYAGHDDSWKREIQSNLLSLLDGKSELVTSHGLEFTVDTRDILFVVGGAFGELRKQLAEKANEKTGMGFTGIIKKLKAADFKGVKVTKTNISEHGFMPEIMGRIHAIAQLDDHTKETLTKILLDADNSLLSQYRDKFGFDDIDLVLSNNLIKHVIKEAIAKNEGARSLREVLDSILNDYLYNADKYKNKSLVVKSRNRFSLADKPAVSRALAKIESFADLDAPAGSTPRYKISY